SDCTCARDLVMDICVPLLTSLVTVLAMLIVVWQLSPSIAFLAAGVSVPLGMMTRWLARPMSERRYHEMELQGDVISLAEQTLSALPVVQAFDRADVEQQRFQGLTQRTIRASLRA